MEKLGPDSQLIEDYVGTGRVESPPQLLVNVWEALESEGKPITKARRLPTAEEIHILMETADLQASFHGDLTSSLLLDEEVRKEFKNKQEVVEILRKFEELNAALTKAGIKTSDFLEKVAEEKPIPEPAPKWGVKDVAYGIYVGASFLIRNAGLIGTCINISRVVFDRRFWLVVNAIRRIIS